MKEKKEIITGSSDFYWSWAGNCCRIDFHGNWKGRMGCFVRETIWNDFLKSC